MQYVLFFHNLLRWLILLAGFWAVVNAITGLTSKRVYSSSDKRSGFLFTTFFDLQLLLGLVLYFGNSWFTQLKEGGAAVMKDANARFFSIEHEIMMILAWILVHMGSVLVKKAQPNAKHKKMLIFFGIAFLLMLISIPWPFRAEVARPWFRSL